MMSMTQKPTSIEKRMYTRNISTLHICMKIEVAQSWHPQ